MNNNKKHSKKFFKIIAIVIVLVNSAIVYGQIPSGYYNSAAGLSGSTLKTALYNIIKNHTVITYDNLWASYQYTDLKSNGKIWDIYTDIPGSTPVYQFTYSTDQCGTYSVEGDCYNREHSFPKSWFNDATPMYSEMFHLYPTDGKVNGMRNNYPFGEVGTASYTSSNGSKLGTCNFPGYTGIVFEPIDSFKGDLARSYFYMATRYENLIGSWENYDSNGDAVLDGTSFPAYESWFITMLLQWNAMDPVSQKEIDRNNMIYNNYQHNRNPFIDHPEYANAIWSQYAPYSTEPSNQAANFSANEIKLTWTDAVGTDIPSGYLIKISTIGYSAISDPVDGVVVGNDANNQNVAYGVQKFSINNPNAQTTYYFKIYPYTGSGTNINYKTGGGVQMINITTN